MRPYTRSSAAPSDMTLEAGGSTKLETIGAQYRRRICKHRSRSPQQAKTWVLEAAGPDCACKLVSPPRLRCENWAFGSPEPACVLRSYPPHAPLNPLDAAD